MFTALALAAIIALALVAAIARPDGALPAPRRMAVRTFRLSRSARPILTPIAVNAAREGRVLDALALSGDVEGYADVTAAALSTAGAIVRPGDVITIESLR